ncbi:MAG: flagellar hook protein [Treponema sp. CETP13]|nr:MAG: flagellar hook protein [Treponema sp. CETP13]
MADISIPGVSNKYNTDELIQALVEEAKVPLNNEKDKLEEYKAQEDAWRMINTQMNKVLESSKNLYSYDNPFNSRMTTSSDENAITIDADRNADIGTYKINVKNIATADRFLSKTIDSDTEVPKGSYKFAVGEKSMTFNWKGGNLEKFVTSLNKRSTGLLKARLIGVTKNSKSLLIESLIPGENNKLTFKDDALTFALDNEIITPARNSSNTFTISKNQLQDTSTLSSFSVAVSSDSIELPPKSGFEVKIPTEVKSDSRNKIAITFTLNDLTEEELLDNEPVLPSAGNVTFKDITINQEALETALPEKVTTATPTVIEDYSSVYLKTSDGNEIKLPDLSASGKSKTYTIDLSDYDSTPESFIIRNNNTRKQLTMSQPEVLAPDTNSGYEAVNPVTTAADAKIQYEGITMTRPDNDIDDVIPNVTLHLKEPTQKTATLEIKPDKDTIKDALIEFVGNYNKLMAQMNIVTQNKEAIISELDYFTDEEVETAKKQLGMFQSEIALTSSKQRLQNIVSNYYRTTDNAEINMLTDIGISTNASSGYNGYSSSQLRGYLEINEDTLDTVLETNLDDIKNIFGYDSDNDKIIDSGVGYLIYQNLHSYTMTGGVIAMKTTSLDSKIETSNTKIASLEEEVDEKEASLKEKYGTMESTLNSLESQSSTIENFTNQNNSK